MQIMEINRDRDRHLFSLNFNPGFFLEMDLLFKELVFSETF